MTPGTASGVTGKSTHDQMLGSLLVLGFTLSLDNFRTAIAFGGLPLSWRRSVQIALMFGFWDGVAPLVGILSGRYWAEAIGSTAEYVGAIALGAYGLYLVVHAWLTARARGAGQTLGAVWPDRAVEPRTMSWPARAWACSGYSLWLAPLVFGATTAVDGLGRAAARACGRRASSASGPIS